MKDGDTGKLGLFASTTLLIGGMFGGAIFSLSGVTIAGAGPAALLSWVIAAGILFLYGLLTAELSTVFPNSGGVFMFPARSLGKTEEQRRVWGWVSCWAYLFGGFGGAAFSAAYVGNYLGMAFPALERWRVPLALAAVVLGGLFNVFNMRVTGKASTVLVLGLVSAMLVFIAAGLFGGTWNAGKLMPFFTQGSGGAFGFISTVPLAMVAYGSIVAVAFMAGEIRRPQKTVPRAMTLGIGVVVCLYTLVLLATLGLVSAGQLVETGMANVPLFAAAYTALTNLPWMPYLISIAAVLALTNNILVLIALLARTVQAASAFGVLPRALAKNSRSGAPVCATALVVSVLAALSAFPGAANFIIGMGTLCSATVVVMICLSVLAMRKKYPGLARFHAPGGRFLPVVMMAVIVACYVPGILGGGWELWACTLAYFAVGMLVFWLSTRRRA